MMDKRQQAENILEELDEVMSINWNEKETLIKAIIKGLNRK
jgi:hypothetical protein